MEYSLPRSKELEELPEPDVQQFFEETALVRETHVLDTVPHRSTLSVTLEREVSA